MAVATLDGEALQIEAMPYPTYHDDTLKGDGLATDPLGINMDTMSAANVEKLKRLLGVDETVLWTGEASGVDATMNLSEAYTNFERVRFVTYEGNQAIPYWWTEVCTNGTALYPSYVRTNSGSSEVVGLWTLQPSNNNKTLTITVATIRTNGGTQGSNAGKILKIVGIHRIAGGNN